VASVCKQTIPTEQPPLVGEVSAKFTDKGCRVDSATDRYGRILGFLNLSRYFFLPSKLNCSHEAEWTPFQPHYFSEKLVAPGIELALLDL
jgi:hypothetical protein